jgi:lipopolysaccharide heptosyltransferase I
MRIVIVKLSAIGDVVHALPAVAALRRALPAARLAWVVEKRAAAILKDSPVIDELIEIDTRAWRKRLISRATITDIRERISSVRGDAEIDIAIDFQGLLKSGLVIKATQARRRIGFATAEMREPLSRFFLTEQIATSRFQHVIDKNLALARAAVEGFSENVRAAFASNVYEFPIAVSADDERYAEEAANNRMAQFAILNPGGGWPTKLWPAERFGELADHLYKQHGVVSYITYGPGEEKLAQAVVSHVRSGAAQVMASTLKQFVALARRAALFVGGDTGPLHLAAAAGAPVVGIYGPTSPQRNGPFNPLDITVGRDLWCRPACHRRTCWHWECMDIPASVVARAASLRLARASEVARPAPAFVQLDSSPGDAYESRQDY